MKSTFSKKAKTDKELFRDYDLCSLLTEAIKLIRLASPNDCPRTWYSRLNRLQEEAEKLKGYNPPYEEQFRLPCLYLSSYIEGDFRDNLLKSLREMER